MASVRDRLRMIIENNLVLEFRDSNALDNPDSLNATLKVLEQNIENVIDLLVDAFNDTK